MDEKRFGHPYYRYMAFLLIVIAIGGFALHGVIKPGNLPPVHGFLILHLAAMVGWYVLFVLQTQLIGRKKHKVHMKLGSLSAILAITIVVSGLAITYLSYRRTADAVIVLANFATLLNFGTLYVLGYIYRRKAEFHRRAMLLAGIAIIAPAIARFIITVDLPLPTVFVFYLLLILSLVAFDAIKFKRIHRLSIIGGGAIFVILLGAFMFGATEGWGAFIRSVWG
ncbi:MAG: hypothetical protein WBO10_12820 [Pyrinomonadaceae bacterium]